MILKDKQPASQWSPGMVAVLLLGALVVTFLLVYYCNNKTITTLPEGGVFCDAETVEGDQFRSGDALFTNAATQSSDFAFSGRYACKLNKADINQYGFGYQLDNPVPGMTYKASVWRFRNEPLNTGLLVVSGPSEQSFYKSEITALKQKDNWEQLEIVFTIPLRTAMPYVQVYVYSDGSGVVYFDDLTIVPQGQLANNLGGFDLDTLRLAISEKAMKKLEDKRLSAFRNGILESTDEDWVSADLSSKNESNKKVKLRLKGDWLDHLEGDKWSFRIKVRGEDAWNRLREFSLHTPEARGFLEEWLLHKLFEREDVLTTRYEFVLLELNGKSLGVYALEEHFDKVLVESRARREGVIIRFSEAGFWESLKRQLQYTNRIAHGLAQNEKRMQAAEVLPFAEGTTFSSPVLAQQFQKAQTLLQQYQLGNKAVEEVFDVDRLARYFALCDVMGAYHGISWHNLRFYFNPLSAKLEPIGYDGFEGVGGYRDGFLGQGALNPRKIDEENFHFRLFLDEGFTEKYVAHLYQFTEPQYLQFAFAEIEEGLRSREKLLQSEFINYQFDEKEWTREALSVHLMLLPQNDISLKAYTQSKTTSGKVLKVGNVHSLPVAVLGYGVNANTLLQRFEKPLLLEGFYPRSVMELLEMRKADGRSLDTMTKMDMVLYYEKQLPLQLQECAVSEQATYLFYKPLGLDTLMHSRIAPFASPYTSDLAESILKPSVIATSELYQLNGNIMFFRKGDHTLQKPLVIPPGYRLHLEAGCKIDLQQSAFIWSASPVTVNGSSDEPVVIQTTDGSGRGFHVMAPQGESVLRYAYFDGLNTLDVPERRLTGAVTFYEAEVEFQHCIFRNNQCEDALNLIRSQFKMNYCAVANTFADGFDADFCKGRIKGSRFTNTGNDGLDISGSVVLVEESIFDTVGDKGISVGEDSDATILSATISNAPIAIAVKDLSTAVISSINLKNCRQGFVVFQKKPEYGAGSIVVENYEAENVVKLYDAVGGQILMPE